jgi:hypothetical protein
MCRTGGPRCNGSHKAQTNAPAATAATEPAAVQRGETNIASGDDRIAVQVGQVGPDAGPPPAVPPVSPAQPGDEPSGPGETVYVVSDNARVGMQAGDVIGDIRFSM